MPNYKVLPVDLEAFAPLIDAESDLGFVFETQVDRIHPLNPETGLPSLPDGYIWRVAKVFDRPYVILIFQRKTVTPPSKFALLLNSEAKGGARVTERKIEDYHINTSAHTASDGIREAAMNLLQHLPNHLKNEVSPSDFKPYYGDYPPKNLG